MVQQRPSHAQPSRAGGQLERVAEAPPPDEVRHVALVGLPGTGKTSVGEKLAQALRLPFIDLDAAIEEVTQKSVATLFAEQGEVMFRAKERARLREILASEEPVVLACGGGTWADATMQRELKMFARPILLTAPVDVLLERLAAERDRRPLLRGPDPRAALERLWRGREAMHALCPTRLDTAQLTVEEVAARAQALLVESEAATTTTTQAHDAAPPERAAAAAPATPPAASVATPEAATLPAAPELSAEGGGEAADGAALPLLQAPGMRGSYPVYLVREGSQAVAACIDAFHGGSRVAVITDTGVAPNHAEALLEALGARGLEVSLHTFAAGEQSKRLATAYALYDELADAGFGRSDLVVSLGGGVVSDLAGFVASTYMRGVAYLQVPTSTLAAVDACIGSKTGLNTHRGKNLVGTFYDPKAVIIAMPYLGTQVPRSHMAGLTEALKVAAVADAELFDTMLRAGRTTPGADEDLLAQVIGRALTCKANIVAADPQEQNEHFGRALLNFGHTIGHAIEAGEGYNLLHGEAVALGMVAEAEWAEAAGLSAGVATALQQALAAMGVATDWRRAKIDFAALARDKKRKGEHLTLPVIGKLGSATLKQVSLAELEAFVGQQRR